MPSATLPAALEGLGEDPDAVYSAFEDWARTRGLTLYPAQEEALLELVTGANVILSTPTGTGKSLVAVGAHAAALASGRRSYYTAPIKALVSEKFFALVDIFGAANVGMVTGDSSVNPDAPIVCCTAEILANLALREGEGADVGVVIMDEFHFYADPERGWAWQVPLLTLPQAQFLLMSATLGEVDWLAEDLSRRTSRSTATVTGVERPVPLSFEYVTTPVHETVEQLLETHRAPVYIVHFSQAAALERAQALTSIRVASREQRDRIADAIGDFRFTTNFGRTLSRLVRAGIGVHHAGMLPKYRRLVEQLAQQGLLRVICGTDTLGVGINVPIRTVLLTALTKYDGQRMRQLTAREFHQIAGRAGRAGFDTAGDVVVQAPEHETENAKALAKAGNDPKKLKKLVRKRPPEGFVSWGEPSFQRLIAAEPERLTSSMAVSHSMILNVVARGGDAFATMRRLLEDNHEPRSRQRMLLRQALAIYRTLRTAGVVEEVGGSIRLTVDLQPSFALNQPLSPFALAVFDLISPPEDASAPASPALALDIVSVLEATLENPRPVLAAQESMARGEAVAAMKAEGIEYEQRMELLEGVTYPKPLEELLDEAFDTYRRSQPWVGDFQLAPKSVVRDLYERAMTFNEYIGFYSISRSEGLVLRYLSDAYRAARQTIPDELKTDELRDLIEWLGELVRQVDSSLLDEWEELAHPDPDSHVTGPVLPPTPRGVTTNERAFLVLVRNALFRRVQLAARERYDALGELDGEAGFMEERWASALEPYWEEHDEILTAADARGPAMLMIERDAREWRVRQILDDPQGNHDWGISAVVDLGESDASGDVALTVTGVDRL
ncbi:DUF3516 domain-containing protein [Salinibacterium sp. SYSU T00001]|uniref:DEAD/DEAH box helicase n=1 Tax=Homoserinimonas sedimenticola TaxID=2986805 RepID=UPI002235AD57|nr:DEAD/DEAH box helicase [Salinibacterium sedimenticola]MCW4384621.1 DUF3516 domain-containing protein [Salinibacterium sedimenticola]